MNDENNRRLSNGSVATPASSSGGHGIIVSSSGGRPLKSLSSASKPGSPPSVVSLASPPCLDHYSVVGAANECGGTCGGGSEDGSESLTSSSSSTALGSPWRPVAPGSDDMSEELMSFVGGTGILSPAVNTVLSSVSSVTTEGESGVEGGGDGQVNDSHDTARDIDVDGDDDGVLRAAEGSGSGGINKSQFGGSGSGNSSGSKDSISVGDITGLKGGRARQLASPRDCVAKQQHPHPQPQSAEHDGKKYMERTRWGGWREVESRTPAAAEASCRNSSRAIVAAKFGGQRKKVVDTSGGTSGGTSGEHLGNERRAAVVYSNKGPYPSSGELCHHCGRSCTLICTRL